MREWPHRVTQPNPTHHSLFHIHPFLFPALRSFSSLQPCITLHVNAISKVLYRTSYSSPLSLPHTTILHLPVMPIHLCFCSSYLSPHLAYSPFNRKPLRTSLCSSVPCLCPLPTPPSPTSVFQHLFILAWSPFLRWPHSQTTHCTLTKLFPLPHVSPIHRL